MSAPVHLLAPRRTPIGAFCGALASIPAPELAARSLQATLSSAGVAPGDVDEAVFGLVIAAGLGQNPARQAARAAGLPDACGATTVNKVCGSGLKAVMLAAQSIRLGDARLVAAGGMESMSGAPFLLAKARSGYRYGHGELLDAALCDGLTDAYGRQSMGIYGDQCAVECGFSRVAQDDFAVRSHERARAAVRSGAFEAEIAPVTIAGKQSVVVSQDEGPSRFDEAKLRQLKPAFGAGGTVTAGNASSLNDGAASVLVASDEFVRQRGLVSAGRIVATATHAREPERFTLAPIGAVERVLERAGWTTSDVDLFEINEAFAVVALAAERELQIPSEKLNVHGGAVALGHPIGASGARVLVTLLHALARHDLRRGVAALCLGGGEAVAVAVERSA
jgi:acetyl-CoA C-acetyltransferase